MKYFIFLLLSTALLLSCTSKNSEHRTVKSIIAVDSLEVFQNKYLYYYQKWTLNNQNYRDSTLYYLDKMIVLNKEDETLVVDKIIFLMRNDLYEDALIQIELLMENEPFPFYIYLKGIISLKLNKDNSNKLLEEAYKEFIKYSQDCDDLDSLSWKIILDYYFKDKLYALTELEKCYKTIDNEYEIEYLKKLEELIKSTPIELLLYNFLDN